MAETNHLEKYLDQQVERVQELVKEYERLDAEAHTLYIQTIILVTLGAGMLLAAVAFNNLALSLLAIVVNGLGGLWVGRVFRVASNCHDLLTEAKAISKQLEVLTAMASAIERAPGPGTRPNN